MDQTMIFLNELMIFCCICMQKKIYIYIHIEDDGINTSKYGIILDHMSFSITNNSRQSYGVKQPRWRLKSHHCWMKYSPISTVIYWSLGSLWETPWFELRINNISGCMMLPHLLQWCYKSKWRLQSIQKHNFGYRQHSHGQSIIRLRVCKKIFPVLQRLPGACGWFS